jgi:tetratricopeptide (TPR) repeat protein
MHFFRLIALALLAAALTACDSGSAPPAATNNNAADESAPVPAEPELTEAERKAIAQEAYERGLQLLAEKQPQDAAYAFDEAIRFDDAHAEAHAQRGKLLVEFDQLDRGANDLYRAIELNPDLEGAYIGLAVYFEKKYEQTNDEADKQRSEENLRIARKIRGEPEQRPTPVNSTLNSILQNTLEKGNEPGN